MTWLAVLLPFAEITEHGLDAREHEVARGEDDADVRVRLKRALHAGQRLLLVPLGWDARDNVDEFLLAFDGLLESIAATDRVDVAEIADEDHRLLLPASLPDERD